jgi:hypothetical protein
MNSFGLGDSLHRLVKQELDSGAAATVAEAEEKFRSYRLALAIGASESADAGHQAALLSAIAMARRVFLGGVSVTGALDAPLLCPMTGDKTLKDAASGLGAAVSTPDSSDPLVTIGGPPSPRRGGFHVRCLFEGWRGGIVPAHSEVAPQPGDRMPLAAMLSAALAVNEAFLFVGARCGAAGRRPIGASLWRPSAEVDWLRRCDDEPRLHYLPARLWVIGLGHLGQAYLWGLGLLPYTVPSRLSLVLQDTDVVTPSSISTSLLSDECDVGRKKTRVAAEWAERRGFATAIVERLFDGKFRRHDQEPAVALCGIDNAFGRQALDEVGFELVVEAGLGRGHRDYRSMRIHTLPGPRRSAVMWGTTAREEDVTERAAYQKLITDGDLDRCGATLLAGKAVGAPFVGAVAACLVLSEVLRLLHGGALHQVIDVNLESMEQRSVVVRSGFQNFNPGYVPAA